MTYKMLMTALLLFVATMAGAQQTTYSFQSEPFDNVFGTYTAGQSVTGSITLSEPLPPGTSNNVNSILVGYSFSDGVVTLDDSNSEIIFGISLTTGPLGQIQSYGMTFWETPLATVSGEVFTGMDITFEPGEGTPGCVPSPTCATAFVQINSGDIACNNVIGGQCVGGTPNPPGGNSGVIFRRADDTGFNPNFDNSSWLGGPPPSAVPALGMASLLLLMLVLAALGCFAMRLRR
jgi:hypothetical protein